MHKLEANKNYWSNLHIAFSITLNDLKVKMQNVMQNVLNQSADKINVNNDVSGGVSANDSGDLNVNANAGMGDFCVLPMDTYGNILH